MTFEENLIAVLNLVGTVIGTIILAYLVYKGQKIEKNVEISEKTSLAIKSKIQPHHYNEIIVISNSGTAPVDKLEAKIEITISPKGSPDITSSLEWECKEVLDVKEEVTIPLHSKLIPILEENNLMKTRKEDFPTNQIDEVTGEYMHYEESIRDLRKIFSITINLEVKSRVLSFPKTIKKTFRLDYDWDPEFFGEKQGMFQYTENFTVEITDVRGNWKT